MTAAINAILPALAVLMGLALLVLVAVTVVGRWRNHRFDITQHWSLEGREDITAVIDRPAPKPPQPCPADPPWVEVPQIGAPGQMVWVTQGGQAHTASLRWAARLVAAAKQIESEEQ